MSAPATFSVSVVVPASAVAAFWAALDPLCEAVSTVAVDGASWRVEGLCCQPPDDAAVDVACRLAAVAAGVLPPPLTIAPIADRDWIASVHAEMPAVMAGRFTVYGRHLDASVARGRIGLAIDATLAFGSGHHSTTAGCLTALSRLAQCRVRRALDLGCGSGVLAIAMAKLWRAEVVAVDIDPRAVAVATANVAANGVRPWVRCVVSDGLSARVRALGPFDVIVANILARPLQRLAGAITAALAHRGWLVLSGFLAQDGARVRRAYAVRGLRLGFRLEEAGWTTLGLRARQ